MFKGINIRRRQEWIQLAVAVLRLLKVILDLLALASNYFRPNAPATVAS